MTYVLEAKNEFDRLERQSQHPNYDFKKELSAFEVPKHGMLLDAGCGSGIVARHFAEQKPGLKVVGCDQSSERITLATNAASHLKNISFQTDSLDKLSFQSDTFDAVICRYVFQHLDAKTRKNALAEFFRVLKPGGRLCIVDSDGLLVNIHPQTKIMASVLKKLAEKGPVDLFVGRKLQQLAIDAGFTSVTHRIETESGNREVELVEERFKHALPALVSFLGNADTAQIFVRDYVNTLKSTGTIAYFNKVIVQTQKPSKAPLKQRLTIVK